MAEKTLHQVLLARLDVAKRFTKDFQDRMKSEIELYDAETPKVKTLDEIIDKDQRYQYTAKTVFDNVEKYRSSFFEKPPEVLYAKKGKNDQEKAEKIEVAWDYIKEKVNFKQFMDDSFTPFALSGFTAGHIGYKKDFETKTGDDGVEYIKFNYDDPILDVFDYENEWFMPDSVFTPDAKGVSHFKKKSMTTAQVYEAFKKKVTGDESILSKDIDEESESVKDELMRAGVYYYTGTLPKKQLLEYIEEVQGAEIDDTLKVDEELLGESKQILCAVFTKKELLKVDKLPIGEQTFAIGRWYALPKKFFGFGLGKLLEEQQRQESIRTGQLIRYADLYAFPKMAIDAKDTHDPKQIMQRNNPVITYKDKRPEFIQPPGSNGAIAAMQAQNQNDIQTNSGLADLSKMQQSQTLQTATGQTQVADTNEKRIKVAKEKYFEFLKQVIIKLFKYAQAEWQEEKVRTITDDSGESRDISISKEDFAHINFDTDISVDFANMSVNKDVVRQQSIVLYDKVKDDPLVDKAKVFKKMLKDGFSEKNPDQFIKESSIQPGMTFTGEDGQQYVADESGSLVLQQDADQSRPSDGSLNPVSDQTSVQSNPMTQANAAI